MPLADIVSVVFSLTNPGVTQAGFGVPMIASPNATWAERTRTYTSLSGVGADWGTATPEYLAAQKMFSQTTGITKIMIGRCANKPTQQYSVGVFAATVNAIYNLRAAAASGSAFPSQTASYTAIASAAWAITTAYLQGAIVANDAPSKLYVCITPGTSAGSGGPTGTAADITDGTVHWMYLGAGAAGAVSADGILYNLKLQLDAFAAPALPTTNTLQGSAGSKTLQVQCTAAGAFVALEVMSMDLLTVIQNHADPGIAADLAQIALASSAWYGLVTLHNSQALIEAAAAWAEANTKLYITTSSETKIATDAETGAATDTAHVLKGLAYARTHMIFHPAPDDFADAAEIARWFPINPGSDNWRLKTLAAVSIKTYTATQVTNITAKYCNYYADLGGVNAVQGDGKIFANDYVDVIRFRDWYVAQLQQGGANLLLQSEKIPFTDDGIAKFEAMIKGVNERGVAAGGIAPNTAVVTVPKVANISTSDKQARWLEPVYSTWTLAGAINKLSVTVQASA